MGKTDTKQNEFEEDTAAVAGSPAGGEGEDKEFLRRTAIHPEHQMSHRRMLKKSRL